MWTGVKGMLPKPFLSKDKVTGNQTNREECQPNGQTQPTHNHPNRSLNSLIPEMRPRNWTSPARVQAMARFVHKAQKIRRIRFLIGLGYYRFEGQTSWSGSYHTNLNK